MKVLLAAVFSIGATLVSCATVPPIETASGRPECTITQAGRQEIEAYILERLVADGWMLKEQSVNQLVVRKENPDALQNALFGSGYDPTTTHELRFIFTEPEGKVRVFGQAALIRNEGSAFEGRTDLTTGRGGYDLWQALVSIAEHFDQQQNPPVEAVADDDSDA